MNDVERNSTNVLGADMFIRSSIKCQELKIDSIDVIPSI